MWIQEHFSTFLNITRYAYSNQWIFTLFAEIIDTTGLGTSPLQLLCGAQVYIPSWTV